MGMPERCHISSQQTIYKNVDAFRFPERTKLLKYKYKNKERHRILKYQIVLHNYKPVYLFTVFGKFLNTFSIHIALGETYGNGFMF